MRLGVIIVAHQSAACLRSCIDASLRFAHPDAGLVVVDNASTDGSATVAASVPGVTVLHNPANRGFAAAANQGFRVLQSADFVLLLNPDAVLQTGLEPLVRCLDDPLTAIAAGALCQPAGVPQAGFTLRRFPTPTALAFENMGLNRIWPRNPINRRWRCLDVDLTKPCAAEQPAGAFLLVRRQAWARLGGFDEGFRPVWFEDVDFCVRIKHAGYRIRYEPLAHALHKGGDSIRSLDRYRRRLYWYGNLLRFASLHFRPSGLVLVALTVGIGAAVRGFWEALRRGSPDPLLAAGVVLRLAAAAPWTSVRPVYGEGLAGHPGVATTERG
jgi:GT2 family glycosyltransferase